MLRHLKRFVKISVAVVVGLAVLGVLGATFLILIVDHMAQAQAAQLAAAKAACTLDPQQFMATVNQWRAAKGVAPLQYSTQLENAAKARIADMEKYQYYGHDNPTTHIQSYTLADQYDPAATTEDEVLDAPNTAQTSITDFKNSSEHYDALIDARYKYLGFVSEYLPEQWAEYDNNGKLQLASGHPIWQCLEIGELADKIGQVPVKAVSGQPTTSSTNQSATYAHDALCTNLIYQYQADLGIDSQQSSALVDSDLAKFSSQLIALGCPAILYKPAP